eukprot:8723554-Lingulodinium_polyedra.AAC.1
MGHGGWATAWETRREARVPRGPAEVRSAGGGGSRANSTLASRWVGSSSARATKVCKQDTGCEDMERNGG